MIAHDLAALVVPINSIQPLQRNARRGDVDAICASLTRWGQVKPIVISSDRQIIAGNHTHAAAVRLGWTEIAAVEIPIHSADTEAIALAIADNRLSDLSRWDNNTLVELLECVQAADDLLLADTGFTSEQVEELVSFMDNRGGAGNNSSSDEREEDNSSGGATCPTCQRPL